jgi:hypothetical protein
MRTVHPHFPSASVIRCPRRSRASSGRPGDKVADKLTALRPTFPIPAAGSVLNPTLARLERDFMQAIHNTQESGGAHQKEIAKRETAAGYGGIRKSLPVRVRGVGGVSLPDSEIECCVPLATSRDNRSSS